MNNPLTKVSHRAFVIWLRNLISYQRYILPTFLASLGEPLLYLVAMGIGLGGYMGQIKGMTYVQFIAPGLVVSAAMFAATFECTFGAMVRMTVDKVYNSFIVSPVSIEDIITGEVLWGITRSMLSGIIITLVLIVFGLARGWEILLYPFLWFSVGFLFSSMALVVTSYAPHFDFFTYYLELFITPMFFFSGIFFPLDNFPSIVQGLGYFLPLTHAVAISRGILYHQLQWGLLLNFAALLIPACLLYIWALVQMKKRLVK